MTELLILLCADKITSVCYVIILYPNQNMFYLQSCTENKATKYLEPAKFIQNRRKQNTRTILFNYLFQYPRNFDGTDDRFCGYGSGNDGYYLGYNGCAWNRNDADVACSSYATQRLDEIQEGTEDKHGGTIEGTEVAHSLLHVSKRKNIVLKDDIQYAMEISYIIKCIFF